MKKRETNWNKLKRMSETEIEKALQDLLDKGVL